jgi:hypothetical protein
MRKFLNRSRGSAAQPHATRIPAGVIEEAKGKPGGWVYEIDSALDPNEAVPPEGIKGAWKVGDDGVPTEEYQMNENYRPAG